MAAQPQPREHDGGAEADAAPITDLDTSGAETVTGGASLSDVSDAHDRYANLDD